MTFSRYEEAESSAVLATIRKTIARERLFALPAVPAAAPGSRLLVAVSGGPDSVAMLYALREILPALGVELEAATVDHRLRPESAAEAAAVAERCQALKIPCAVVPVDVLAARGGHVSLQDAARRVRLAALEARARERGCRWVALGHTADDQAETILFRIVRGTGVLGLSGIPYARPPFVRPLLDVRRDQVLQFLRKRAVTFVEDPSNADRRFTRSRVRHDWLPFLARENPRVVEALLALGREARAGGIERGQRAGVGGPGRRAAAKVAELAASGRGTRFVHYQGGIAEVAYGQIRLTDGPKPERHPLPRSPAEREEIRVPISGPGQYRWPRDGGVSLEIDVVVQEGPAPDQEVTAGRWRGRAVARLSGKYLAEGLYLRPRRPGDRMRPRGGAGSRKLQDLLVDAKIPRGERDMLPVLCTAGGTILFVPGLRPAEAGRPEAGAERWLEISISSRDRAGRDIESVG